MLRSRGACFRSDMAAPSGRLPPEVDEGPWDLVARGIVTADACSAVRSLLSSRGRRPSGLRRVPGRSSPLGHRRALAGSGIGEGRWSVVPEPDDGRSGSSTAPAAEELAEAVGQALGGASSRASQASSTPCRRPPRCLPTCEGTSTVVPMWWWRAPTPSISPAS